MFVANLFLWVNVKYFLGDTLSFVGDQTSYMSICVGEEHDDSLSQLSAQNLRHKVNNKIQIVEFSLDLRCKNENLHTKCLQTKKLKVYIYISVYVLGARPAGVCKQPTDFKQ